MGVQTDFFIASSDELKRVFRGWARPLPLLDEFVTRRIRNPFTGEETTIRSRVPEGGAKAESDAVEWPDLSPLASLDQKGLSTIDLVNLARALLSWDQDNANSEIHGRMFSGPSDAEGVLVELPASLTSRLAALTPDDSKRTAGQWAALFREDAATVENELVREHLLRRPDAEWVERLAELAKLARSAVASSRAMFMWMTP